MITVWKNRGSLKLSSLCKVTSMRLLCQYGFWVQSMALVLLLCVNIKISLTIFLQPCYSSQCMSWQNLSVMFVQLQVLTLQECFSIEWEVYGRNGPHTAFGTKDAWTQSTPTLKSHSRIWQSCRGMEPWATRPPQILS